MVHARAAILFHHFHLPLMLQLPLVQPVSFSCRRLLLRRLGSFLLCLLDDDLFSDEPLAELAEQVVEDDGAGDDADEYDDDDDGSVHCRGRVSCWWGAVRLLRFAMFGEECRIGFWRGDGSAVRGICLEIARWRNAGDSLETVDDEF